MIRINKYLSICGVTSRRGADALIKDEQVTVNDNTLIEVGTIIDETKDVVKVGGVKVSPVEEKYYLVLNKPQNVMTTLHDPFKRKTIVNFLKEMKDRVYPVGRLDYDAQGVLLLTNDGDLAFRLSHPKYQVRRVYEVRVKGKFIVSNADIIRKGIKLEDGKMGKAEQVSILSANPKYSRVRIVMTEGRKREVKQLCQFVGHQVEELVRVDYGGITLKALKAGAWRVLTSNEVSKLKGLVGLKG